MIKTIVSVICCIAWTVAIIANVYAAIKLHEFNKWLEGELRRGKGGRR